MCAVRMMGYVCAAFVQGILRGRLLKEEVIQYY